MRPSKYLKRLRRKTSVRHLSKLRTLADGASQLALPESDRVISYVTIACLNTWANFARTYFLSCTLAPWREQGLQIQCNTAIRTFDDAIDAAMKRCKPLMWKQRQHGNWTRRDEPVWHVPKNLIDSCDEIGCSNYTAIQNAFSIQTKVFDHLSTFRNFYAHRNDETAIKTQKIAGEYTIPFPAHPSEILLSHAYGRPQILILDWIDDLDTIVQYLCE